MVSERLGCSQMRDSECPQGCVSFGFSLRELQRSSYLRLQLVSRLQASRAGKINVFSVGFLMSQDFLNISEENTLFFHE